jgi:hypothetical protein
VKRDRRRPRLRLDQVLSHDVIGELVVVERRAYLAKNPLCRLKPAHPIENNSATRAEPARATVLTGLLANARLDDAQDL